MSLALEVAGGAASALEHGTFGGPAARALSAIWEARSRVCRPVVLPSRTAVVGIGGPTLGGSYKTPLVLALARALALDGESVAVVGHGHGARLRSPRRVLPTDDVRDVGDEALLLARELAALGVPVVVGPREGALALAATLSPRILVDGLLQATPERLALSVLAVDAERPFGTGRCPPAGDLRARPRALLEATDVVACVGRTFGEESVALPQLATGPLPSSATSATSATSERAPATVEVREHTGGARDARGDQVPLASLRAERVGLVLAIARPDRVIASLHAHGIFPSVVRTFLDHSRPSFPRIHASPGVSVWLTTGKCRTKVGPEIHGSPVLVLEHRLEPSSALVERVRAAQPRPLSSGKNPW